MQRYCAAGSLWGLFRAILVLGTLIHPEIAVCEPLPVLNRKVNLEDALQHAFSQHPELHAARSRIPATQGTLLRAQTYPYNLSRATVFSSKSLSPFLDQPRDH